MLNCIPLVRRKVVTSASSNPNPIFEREPRNKRPGRNRGYDPQFKYNSEILSPLSGQSWLKRLGVQDF